MSDGPVLEERKEQLFVSDEYKVFIVTGQSENGRRSGLRIKPFNKLSAGDAARLRAQAQPLEDKNGIGISSAEKEGRLTFTDKLTGGTASVPLSDLDLDVQRRLGAPTADPFARILATSPANTAPAPKKKTARNAFLAAVLGLTAAGGLFTAHYYSGLAKTMDAVFGVGPAATNTVKTPPGFVDKQVVKTVFINDEIYPGDTTFSWEPFRAPFHTETVKGSFPSDQAYRYEVVRDHYNTRDLNTVTTYTSARDLTSGMTGEYTKYNVPVAADAVTTKLSDLPAAERDRLRDVYAAESAKVGADGYRHYGGAYPTGLVDPALYTGKGRDGYAFKVWGDAMNGGGGFRDVTGVYDGNEKIPGRKVVTEAVINADGRVCTIQGDTPGDYEEWKQFKYNCVQIEKMKPAEVQALKDRAARLGIELVDETIHTYVRDASGKVVAQDATQTLLQGPVRLRTDEPWKLPEHPQSQVAGAVDTYVFMDLDAAGKTVARVISASFPKGTFAEGTVPEVRRVAGEFEFSRPYDGNYGRQVWSVAGRKTLADSDPTGYSIRYVSDRFAAHGKPSHLPRNQRNEFGA